MWNRVTAVDDDGLPLWRLRPDELAVLETACHQTDRAADLLAEVKAQGSSIVTGSQGQPVIDSRITEARLCEVAARQALAQLKLPDLDADPHAGGEHMRRERAARAARARWNKEPEAG